MEANTILNKLKTLDEDKLILLSNISSVPLSRIKEIIETGEMGIREKIVLNCHALN